MTDEKQKDEADDAAADVPSGPASGPDAGPQPAPADGEPEAAKSAEPARPSRLPTLPGLAALAVSTLALAATGWLWFSERGPDELATANRVALDQLSESLGNARATLRDNEQGVSGLRTRDGELADEIDDARRALEERLEPLESVPGRLTSLEASLAALQGISSGVRDTWLLAEAEYYMEIANAQLELAGNPDLALIALELADERVAQVASPGLTDVRRALADELRALNALDAPDVEGAALTLASLAEAVESLPLRDDVVRPAEGDAPVDEELSGFDRAMASLRTAMSDVVSVRRTDETVQPLLPPDQAYFLHHNLALQLQAARLALLRGERTIFEQSLDDAAEWIGEYFDTDRQPVSGALETLADLEESQTTVSLPDISRSLTLLRRYLAREAQDRETGAGQPQ